MALYELLKRAVEPAAGAVLRGAMTPWVLVVCLLSAQAMAVPYGPYNRPGDTWRVTETKYFRFYWTDDAPKTATHLIAIADDIYERLNRFYRYEPAEKLGVTVVGYTAYSNGFAEYSKNRITIFPTPPNFTNRSRVPWLENVFTHELSHILSLNRADSWLTAVPLVLGTGLVRYDPAFQSSVRIPVLGGNSPHWFKEGVAQFDTYLLGHDGFDENRRAFQRACWEDGLLYPFQKLAFFGGEKWYNTGFSFLLFLEIKFGAGTVHKLFHESGQRYYYDFPRVFESVLGTPLAVLEEEFRAEVQADYSEHQRNVGDGARDGEPVVLEGLETSYRSLTADEKEYNYKSYRSRPSRWLNDRLIYRQHGAMKSAVFDPATLTLKDTITIGSVDALAPQTDTAFFVLRAANHSPSLLPTYDRPEFESADLWLVEAEGDETLLIRESRLMDLDTCGSRSEIAGIYNDGDGSLKLALIPVDNFQSERPRVRLESAVFPLAQRDFDEVRHPRYSPDCSRLYFSRRIGPDHGVFYYDFATKNVVTVSDEEGFELYPQPTEDGVFYVSAADGTMDIHYLPADSDDARPVTQALTAHHYVVPSPHGLFFNRVYATGMQTHFLPQGEWAEKQDEVPRPRRPKPAQRSAEIMAQPDMVGADSYNSLSPRDLVAPSIVPILYADLDLDESSGSAFSGQVGVELFLQDQLRNHTVLARGLVGNRSNFLLSYRNYMTIFDLHTQVGLTQVRSAYGYSADPYTFDRVARFHWGYVNAGVGLPLNLYYTVRLFGSTIRDTGTILGAAESPYTFKKPRYARDLVGLELDYVGLDKSSPTFSQREINKRGYRKFSLEVYHGQEYVHPNLEQYDATIRGGITPFWRYEFDYTEYIALPKLGEGFFDHTLQIDVQLGYIDRDTRFLNFIGGGRLYSMTSPELNTSVGFVGYRFFSLTGETLMNVGATYRFPMARKLGWDLGPFYVEDIYGQLFTSWGNIWGYTASGKRQVPFVDRAPNGQHILGDVGFDVRIGHYFQELNGNFGTTLRAVYRVMPFTQCPYGDVEENPECLGDDGRRAVSFYVMLGGGF